MCYNPRITKSTKFVVGAHFVVPLETYKYEQCILSFYPLRMHYSEDYQLVDNPNQPLARMVFRAVDQRSDDPDYHQTKWKHDSMRVFRWSEHELVLTDHSREMSLNIKTIGAFLRVVGKIHDVQNEYNLYSVSRLDALDRWMEAVEKVKAVEFFSYRDTDNKWDSLIDAIQPQSGLYRAMQESPHYNTIEVRQ